METLKDKKKKDSKKTEGEGFLCHLEVEIVEWTDEKVKVRPEGYKRPEFWVKKEDVTVTVKVGIKRLVEEVMNKLKKRLK